MWTDTVGFTPFTPLGPDAPTLATPLPGATSVPTTSALVWNIATFATSYDVYLGTSEASLALVGNVPAQMNNNPPSTGMTGRRRLQLQPGTTYFWQIVSRTNATIVNPSLVASSSIGSFTTSGTAGSPVAPLEFPSPASGSTSVGQSPTLAWSSRPDGHDGTTSRVQARQIRQPTWRPASRCRRTSPGHLHRTRPITGKSPPFQAAAVYQVLCGHSRQGAGPQPTS